MVYIIKYSQYLFLNILSIFEADIDNLYFRYRDDGHTTGESPFPPPNPIRLEWDISEEVGL